MGQGYHVDPAQLRAHVTNLEKLRARFDAIKAASAHITRDDEAYGLLCGWIAGVLEDRHRKQDELIAYLEENLSMVAESVRAGADAYEKIEGTNSDLIRTAGELEQA
ncbi:type VII secretion target [Amycolatopsis sp. 195334CR]|uniref:type VII secretion target n=1 Tax=Amycolatopsis sp. 195334CR TaxID=2814588 RepID=UPI001A8C51AF|nr:type VII secretion target [Amycolatopsis sp. 195334CR]MBN6039635.1 hypothetical protein [Amycolatopsis sp. 195334CR]